MNGANSCLLLGFAASLGALSTQALANNDVTFHGEVQFEQRHFLATPSHRVDNSVNRLQQSLMIEGEWLWQSDNTIINIKPFARVDSHDSERTHLDFRELRLLHYWDDYEVSAGIGRVFWGVTESTHLVDVINQTDGVEGFDGEDKLGQPMLRFKAVKSFGTFESFVLPYFRERTIPSRKSRLGLPTKLADSVTYESSQEEKHIDVALRYSHTADTVDFALSYFKGTNRDPYFQRAEDSIAPYYAQMNQLGLELQTVQGDWLWKLEARYRDSLSNEIATTAGFEYTQVGVLDTYYDLGWIAEYSYDNQTYALNQNDVFVGWRLAFNDADSSEILFGISHDLDHAEYAVKLEASGRLAEHWKWQVEGWGFSSSRTSSPLHNIENDDFISLAMSYFF